MPIHTAFLLKQNQNVQQPLAVNQKFSQNLTKKASHNDKKNSLFQKTMKKFFIALLLVILFLPLTLYLVKRLDISEYNLANQVDDWQYNPENLQETAKGIAGGLSKLGGSLTNSMVYESAPMLDQAENIGLAVGGAKDINNFRENIKNNYLPLSTDLTYEGLFYDYYFDPGESYPCDQLFCPSYSYAVTQDPFSQVPEYYLAVGLNSGLKEADFQRKKLNLVVVLDMSGSMSSAFNQYYYDQQGIEVPAEVKNDEDYQKSKMEIANKAVVALLDHLRPDDRLAMVLFDDQAYLAKPLNLVADTRLDKIKDHILEIKPRGGTNMEAGLQKGTQLYKEVLEDLDNDEYENRIIFLTDAMPNLGNTSEQSLLSLTKKNAQQRIYTSFIGIGVDFNSQLVEAISKVRGANYYSVHSSQDFKQRLADEFEYMVTPLVFNLVLNLQAKGYQIEKVYGSPEANEATGEIMKVNTLFPSKKEAGQTKGGIVVLKLKMLSPDNDLKLSVSYEDRHGRIGGEEITAVLNNQQAEYFDNSGIRKAILLIRYANLVKNWLNDEWQKANNPVADLQPVMTRESGIVIPPVVEGKHTWERPSTPLKVSANYQPLFFDFQTYFLQEATVINDVNLKQEQEILEKLVAQ